MGTHGVTAYSRTHTLSTTNTYTRTHSQAHAHASTYVCTSLHVRTSACHPTHPQPQHTSPLPRRHCDGCGRCVGRLGGSAGRRQGGLAQRGAHSLALSPCVLASCPLALCHACFAVARDVLGLRESLGRPL